MNFNLLKYRKMCFKDFIFFPLLIRELLIFFIYILRDTALKILLICC